VTWNVRESIRRAISSRLTVPVLAGGAAIALGILVMLGWALRLPLLTSILPGAIPMQPVTALALILGGAGLVAAARPMVPALFPNCLAGAVLLLALLDLGEFAAGADFGLDAMLFPAAVAGQPFAMAHPGRMAEPTVFCFLLAGIALLLVRREGRTAALAFSASATSILLPVALTLLCYLFDAAPTPGLFGFTQVSIPTAAGLVLLAVGLLALRPDAGWMPLLLGDTVGAGAVRRLLPILVLVPILVGWLAQGGMLLGFYSAGHRLAIVTALSIALLAAVTIGAATRFDRLDAILATEHALREAEQRLREAQADLIHAARVSELGAMGATLAHELNQPLAAIVNYLTVCQRLVEAGGTAPRELKRALAHALASTERATEIIRRLRDFVIKGEVHRAPHDINAIVEDALVLALAGGVLRNAGTEVDLDPTARWVLADAVQIQQVLTNLLRNAVEMMEGMARRDLLIATRRAGKMVEISVADSGPGLAGEDAERLFASFYSAGGAGMGLGLSISRTIVEAHGGRIWAEPGETGAVFRFTLPAAAAPRRRPAAEAA
jgi:signal transduction histidine kinase